MIDFFNKQKINNYTRINAITPEDIKSCIYNNLTTKSTNNILDDDITYRACYLSHLYTIYNIYNDINNINIINNINNIDDINNEIILIYEDDISTDC